MVDHGKLIMRIEVYQDGFTIIETKDSMHEGFTSAMQDMMIALMFLVTGAVKEAVR